MISKPTDTISFMKKLNEDLKINISCKHIANYIKIQPASEEQHIIITKYLDITTTPYHIITPQGLRPVKCVIRGLPINIDPELIKSALTEQKFTVLNVFQLRKRDQERSSMPLFQIQLESSPISENIWNIDSQNQSRKI
ncbi:hypothetical protein CDAR_401791 [Caerostris darwini]|uniref:Pre-C2HC domain-containing protein n=1 Tax=Caerostris darwini TaxID=1538125 RepID=A0AAV4V1N1_9ARAC|nr:hypothetical protein CDAR_401791 [Caerostris darwini]